jgi:hypothetical protein
MNCRAASVTTADVSFFKKMKQISIKFETSGTYNKLNLIQWRSEDSP